MTIRDRFRGLFRRNRGPDSWVPEASKPKRGQDAPRDKAWFLARTFPKGGNVHRNEIARRRRRNKMRRATKQAQRRRAA